MDSSFFLYWPDPEKLKRAGFDKLAYIPCVFDSHWRYAESESAYLGIRGRARLKPNNAGPVLQRTRIPTPLSMRTIGEALVNFLEWCSVRGKQWEAMDYDDILSGYQTEMANGKWSVRHAPLSARTINFRVGEACRFLEWTASVNIRPPFEVPRTKISIHQPTGTLTHGHNRKVVDVRVGAVRPAPFRLRIPTDAEVGRWLKGVLAESGYTKHLICRLILETGIRREEAVQWRVDTLPLEKARWECKGDRVLVEISYGAKGPKERNHRGDLVGPTRSIAMPLALAEELYEYNRSKRPILRAKFVRAGQTDSERRHRLKHSTDRLFLSDSTGEPVSAQRLYTAWSGPVFLPFAGWSVHLGRHWWACKKLLKAVDGLRKIQALNANYGEGDTVLTASATDVINLEIRPQLGHVSADTSQAYLVWIRQVFQLTAIYDEYEKDLEEVTDPGPVDQED